jgi:ribosomal protein L17|tara:strand:+ start:435 stop:842 length:408 start_codon:yes stop_codon:yes gene_type:complete
MSKKFKDIYTHTITSTEEREQQLVDSIDVLLPEERVAEYIAKHSDDIITDELVESYIQKASSTDFNVDPIITEIKVGQAKELRNKLDYVLKDGTKIAISEENQILLNSLLKDKDEIVSHMSENKNNFIEVLKGVY